MENGVATGREGKIFYFAWRRATTQGMAWQEQRVIKERLG